MIGWAQAVFDYYASQFTRVQKRCPRVKWKARLPQIAFVAHLFGSICDFNLERFGRNPFHYVLVDGVAHIHCHAMAHGDQEVGCDDQQKVHANHADQSDFDGDKRIWNGKHQTHKTMSQGAQVLRPPLSLSACVHSL